MEVVHNKIIIGTQLFSQDWKPILHDLSKLHNSNIIVCDFTDIITMNYIIIYKKVKYILPLSSTDYQFIKTHFSKLYNHKNITILYPTEETFQLLDNKNQFTHFMLQHYPAYIPTIYYLDNIQLEKVEYPAICKPMYSTNGKNMIILYDDIQLKIINNYNNIQQFIEDEYEYGAYILCIRGQVINWKIIRHKYKKHTIKRSNFPNNYENVDQFDMSVFIHIIGRLNYTGGLCINFKWDETNQRLYIFEINPRFGGSAFTCHFIYELLCIK